VGLVDGDGLTAEGLAIEAGRFEIAAYLRGLQARAP
jgi:hypothetical protein